MRKENVIKFSEVAVDVINTGVTAVKAFNNVTTLIPAALLKDGAVLEVEKDPVFVEFQIQMACEIYKKVEEEFNEFISPERREQAFNEFKDIADMAFDAFDEVDAKLSLTERCSNIVMNTLNNAHRASILDKKKAAAEKAYKMIMGIEDEATIMSLENTVLPVIETAIEDAPTTETALTPDNYEEINRTLEEASVLFEEQQAIESKEVDTPQLQAPEDSEEALRKVMNLVVQEVIASGNDSPLENLTSYLQDENQELFERCIFNVMGHISKEEYDAVMSHMSDFVHSNVKLQA